MYGINGAAISSGLASFLASAAYITAAYRLTRVRIFDMAYLKPVFSIMLSALLAYLIKSSIPQTTLRILYLPAIMVIFLVTYLVLLFATKTITRDDKSVLKFLKDRISQKRNLTSLKELFAH